MKFDLIIIGNELLNGKIKDLNTHFLAQSLFQHGHELRLVQIIQDSAEGFKLALDNSINNSDVIITTGGLGPTKDDLTKSMLSNYFNKEIIYSEEAFKITNSHYDRSKREYNSEKIDYHNIPKDFFPIKNPTGYAPGLGYKFKKQSIFSLPGVPLEFQSMLTEEVLPQIDKSTELTEHITIKTWKIAEAKIFHELCTKLWQELEGFGEVSSLPHVLGVDIGIKVSAHTESDLISIKKEVLNLVSSSKLEEYIWHIGAESLEEVIISEAKAKKLTLGFAESCTGGLCASRITDVSGSSAVFWGSIISYANQVKSKSLKVEEETLINFGAVSKETALEMANGAKCELGVDIAISTTGIAGPGGGSKEKPVGTVGIGVSSSKSNHSTVHHFSGNRQMLKLRFSQIALMTMLEEIRKY